MKAKIAIRSFLLIAALLLTLGSASAQITVVNTSTTASGKISANFSATIPSYDMGAANALAVFFTAENGTTLEVSFDGVPMTVVSTLNSNQLAGIAYVIHPAVTVGDIVISSTYSGVNRLSWEYNIVSLANVGSVAGSETRITNGNLTYTTSADGGFVLAAAGNNSYQGPAPTVTGNPDQFLANGAFDGNHAVIHAYGDVATAGTYNDAFAGLFAAATVAFNSGDAPPPPAGDFSLTITPAVAPATGFDLAWGSQSGKLYNLRTSTDLATAIATWDLVEGDIAATPPTNTRNVDPADPRRFYAVEEIDAPAP